MAEFVYNNSVNCHGLTPFRAVLSYDPQIISINRNMEPSSLSAEAWLGRMEKLNREIYGLLCQEMSQRAQRSAVDKSRKFNTGVMVLVDHHNLTVKDGVRKLSDKFIGIFKVVAEVGSYAYRLELPRRMRMHNVIYVSLLKPYYSTRDGPNWRLDESERPVEAEPIEYDVEAILDSRRGRSGVVYRTRWLGFTVEEDTWEPLENLRGSVETENLVREFNRRNPNKPRDGRLTILALEQDKESILSL